MQTERPRILTLTQRHFSTSVARCSHFEFEDVLRSIDSVEMVAPSAEERRPLLLSARSTQRLRKWTGLDLSMSPRVRPVTVDRDYELFFFVALGLVDFDQLALVNGWRERCRKAVCWIDEIWIRDLQFHKMLEPLKDFDFVFSVCAGTAASLSSAIGRPCLPVAPGIDAIRFCPLPNFPSRSIDVFCMGRRSPETHRALVGLAEEGRIFYMFDTFKSAGFLDAREHRLHLANLIKRSKYFLAYKAKVNAPEETMGQEELGQRYLEGTSGGAVLLGELPKGASLLDNFDWPDAVIELPYGSTKVGELLVELNAQPQRLNRIRSLNVTNALLRNDWVYRWETILRTVGLPGTDLMARRRQELQRLAEQARQYSGEVS